MKFIKHVFTVIFRDFKYIFKSKLPLSFRLKYPFSKYYSLIQSTLFKRKTINYLNGTFHYDNWTTPISLQQYPHEIVYKILNNTTHPINSILDIGGNIGQFSRTINFFLPKSQIHVFEPNKTAFEILEKNTKQNPNIRTYNYGIGKNSKQELHFIENKTATGSLIAQNATSQLQSTKTKTQIIQLIDNPAQTTEQSHFDLIKVDVEGYEYEVLQNLQKISAHYLFLEISGNREKSFTHSAFFNEITKKFGEFNILYQTEFSKEMENFEILLEINHNNML